MYGGRSKLSLAILALFITPGLATSPSAQIPPEPVAELDVPLVQQWGDKSNCGPSAAAMVLGAYRSETDTAQLAVLRDKMGRWSWNAFALRRVKIPGVRGGWTTPKMLARTLNHFSHRTRFQYIQISTSSAPTTAASQLTKLLQEGRPVLALVQTNALWPRAGFGLHWVVVRGLDGTHVVINDPADKTRATFPLARFLRAWQLDPMYRVLSVVSAYSAVVAEAPLPPRNLASR